MIYKKLLPYVDFIERDRFDTVWRIHLDYVIRLRDKDSEYVEPDGIEEIQEKLVELLDVIEKYSV